TTPGGVWTRTNTMASVSPTGTVIGPAPGIDTIVYLIVASCGSTVKAEAIVTVNPLAITGPITGPGSVCQGSHITLLDAAAGGTWHSSNTSGVTIDGTGRVTALLPGTYTISYIITNSCGTDTAKRLLIVDPLVP